MFRTTLLTVAAISVSCCRAVLGSIWYVGASVPESGDVVLSAPTVRTIQEGIDSASDGDMVVAAEGTYVENIRFNGKNITLTSTNPFDSGVVASTIIDGNASGPVVFFDGIENETCVLSGFTIRNRSAKRHGGEWLSRVKKRLHVQVLQSRDSAVIRLAPRIAALTGPPVRLLAREMQVS